MISSNEVGSINRKIEEFRREFARTEEKIKQSKREQEKIEKSIAELLSKANHISRSIEIEENKLRQYRSEEERKLREKKH